MRTLKDLLIPVNPRYDFAHNPAEQAEYVNPVVLNNLQLLHANAAIEISDRLGRHHKRLAELKNQRDDVRGQHEDIETALLHYAPPPPNDRKTNKLLEAYVQRVAEAEGKLEPLKQLIAAERLLAREIVVTEAAIEAGKQAWQCIRLLGEHGQTHLSYVKEEYRQHTR